MPPTAGTGFYSSASNAGFKTGLADFQQKTPDVAGTSSGMGNGFSTATPGLPGQRPPGAPGAGGPDVNAMPDWQLLDDGRSRWW